MWPRILWLNPDNEAPGIQRGAEAFRSDATAKLGSQAFLSGFDALESVMHTLQRRVARRSGQPVPPFEWRTPAASCVANFGRGVQATPAVSEQK